VNDKEIRDRNFPRRSHTMAGYAARNGTLIKTLVNVDAKIDAHRQIEIQSRCWSIIRISAFEDMCD